MVSGSLVDISCLVHRLINFAGTLCKTLCPLPSTNEIDSLNDGDIAMLKEIIKGRKNILENLLQVHRFLSCKGTKSENKNNFRLVCRKLQRKNFSFSDCLADYKWLHEQLTCF